MSSIYKIYGYLSALGLSIKLFTNTKPKRLITQAKCGLFTKFGVSTLAFNKIIQHPFYAAIAFLLAQLRSVPLIY